MRSRRIPTFRDSTFKKRITAVIEKAKTTFSKGTLHRNCSNDQDDYAYRYVPDNYVYSLCEC